jgi:hypothetical protein
MQRWMLVLVAVAGISQVADAGSKGKAPPKSATAPTPATAQPESIAPPAKEQPDSVGPATTGHKVDGPSMEETAAWLVQKLNANKASYTTTAHGVTKIVMRLESVETYKHVFEYSGAKLEKCELSYREKSTTSGGITMNGEPDSDPDPPQVTELPFAKALTQADPLSIRVEETNFKLVGATGTNYAQITVDKPTWMVVLERYDTMAVGPIFEDHEMATRVVKAIQHAIDLCGGGKTEPF